MRYVWIGVQGRFPAAGGGLTLSQWLVREGDRVKRDQPVAVVGAELFDCELPSPVAGRVERLHVEPGGVLRAGIPFVTFEDVDPQGGETGQDAV